MKKQLLKAFGSAFIIFSLTIFLGCVNVNSNNGNSVNDEGDGKDTSELYKDFANYPLGKQNSSGTLTLKN